MGQRRPRIWLNHETIIIVLSSSLVFTSARLHLHERRIPLTLRRRQDWSSSYGGWPRSRKLISDFTWQVACRETMWPLYLEAFEANYKTKLKTIKSYEDSEISCNICIAHTWLNSAQQCATVSVTISRGFFTRWRTARNFYVFNCLGDEHREGIEQGRSADKINKLQRSVLLLWQNRWSSLV